MKWIEAFQRDNDKLRPVNKIIKVKCDSWRASVGVHTEALASCIGRADAEEQLTLISWLELQTSGDI